MKGMLEAVIMVPFVGEVCDIGGASFRGIEGAFIVVHMRVPEVLWLPQMLPSILLAGFLSHPIDERLLAGLAPRVSLALEGTPDGLCRHVQTSFFLPIDCKTSFSLLSQTLQ